MVASNSKWLADRDCEQGFAIGLPTTGSPCGVLMRLGPGPVSPDGPRPLQQHAAVAPTPSTTLGGLAAWQAGGRGLLAQSEVGSAPNGTTAWVPREREREAFVSWQAWDKDLFDLHAFKLQGMCLPASPSLFR